MLTQILLGLIALMLVAGPAVAQETRTPGELTDGDADVGTSAFVTPPTGYTVIYHFTGARTSTNIGSSVHCSNLLGAATPVRVEVYGYTGLLLGVGGFTVPQYNTTTFSIGPQSGGLYAVDIAITTSDSVNQGIIRILKKGTGRIICAAQIYETSVPPAFILPLVQYGPTGLH